MSDRDFAHFKNMYKFAGRVENRISDVSLETFLADEYLQDSILYAIGHIGESANEISEETKAHYHSILWNALIGIRNRVFHSYEDVDMSIVYKAAKEHTPVLIEQLQRILGHD